MRVIIAGSRTITDAALVEKAVKESGFEITEVVSGCASGVDTLAISYGFEHNIPVKKFPADWKKYSKAAGMIRNKQMGDYTLASGVGGLIALWDGTSRGTKGMIEIAKKLGLKMGIQ